MIEITNHPPPEWLDLRLTWGGYGGLQAIMPAHLPSSPGSLREKRQCTNPFAAIDGGTPTPLQFGTARVGAIRRLQAQSRSACAPICLIQYPQANMLLRIW